MNFYYSTFFMRFLLAKLYILSLLLQIVKFVTTYRKGVTNTSCVESHLE